MEPMALNRNTTSNYAKFKEQTREAFLKIMGAMYPDKITKEENDSIVSDENKNLEIQKKHMIEDVQDIPSKAIILNNRDVIKVCAVQDVKEKAKDTVSDNVDSNNELIIPNDTKHPNKNVEKLSQAKVSNISLFFSRSTMLFSSAVYNKHGELWYGLPKERKC